MRAQGAMYKAVLKSVLSYGSESWLVTRDILKVLMEFRHQAVQRTTGMMKKCGAGVVWEYSVVDEAIDAAVIYPIGVYIKRRQTTIAEIVACHHGAGADAGDKPYGALVGSRNGKLTGGIDG